MIAKRAFRGLQQPFIVITVQRALNGAAVIQLFLNARLIMWRGTSAHPREVNKVKLPIPIAKVLLVHLGAESTVLIWLQKASGTKSQLKISLRSIWFRVREATLSATIAFKQTNISTVTVQWLIYSLLRLKMLISSFFKETRETT